MNINAMSKKELNIMLTMLANNLSEWRYIEADELGCGVFIEQPVEPWSGEVKVINYCEEMDKLMPLVFANNLSIIAPSKRGGKWCVGGYADKQPEVAIVKELIRVLSGS